MKSPESSAQLTLNQYAIGLTQRLGNAEGDGLRSVPGVSHASPVAAAIPALGGKALMLLSALLASLVYERLPVVVGSDPRRLGLAQLHRHENDHTGTLLRDATIKATDGVAKKLSSAERSAESNVAQLPIAAFCGDPCHRERSEEL